MTLKALILVDLENEWTDQNSNYFIGDISVLIQKTNQLIDYCRKNNYKIIFIRHIEKDSQDCFAPNSKNVEIIKELHRQDSDALITKNKISSFYQTNLAKELQGIKEIMVAGILTNLCVRSLVENAYDRGFKITVIKDCCQAFNKETHDFTIKDLQATREELKFLNLDEFMK